MQPDPLIGQIIDQRYAVRSLLGKGGMGRVYRVNQIAVNREVALKCIAFEHLQNAVAVRRFKREAAIIAKLRHPNTLKLLDVGELPGGGLYIVSPLLVGAPLDALLAQAGPLEPLRVLRLMEHTLASLSEAHAEGVVHRDLKPGNLFIEQLHDEEYVKVLDFGIARLVTAETPLTQEATSPGTPWYMSPEQIRGDKTIDGRSDLYALGCLAIECLTGRPPFTADLALAVAIKHLSEPPPALADLRPDHAVPPEVEAVLMWCLEKDPALRPANAKALRAAIKPLLHQLEAQGARATGAMTATSNVSAPAFGSITDESKGTKSKGPWLVLGLLGVLGLGSALALIDHAGSAQQDAAAPTPDGHAPALDAALKLNAPDQQAPDAQTPDAHPPAAPVLPPEPAPPAVERVDLKRTDAQRARAQREKIRKEAERKRIREKAKADARARRMADALAKQKAEADARAKQKAEADARAKQKAEADALAKQKAEAEARRLEEIERRKFKVPGVR